MSDYFTILTAAGATQFANHLALGDDITLLEFAVGDGKADDGDPEDYVAYNPDGTETALRNEKYRGNITNTYIDPENDSTVILEGVVPSTVGGWYVTEMGIFDDQGTLIAIANTPPQPKTLPESGAPSDLLVRFQMKTASAAQAQLVIDPAIGFASKSYVAAAILAIPAHGIGDIDGLSDALNKGWVSKQIFTTSGTWTKPTGITRVRVTAVGGGGGGASQSTNNNAGAGAGGGGCAILDIDVSAIDTVPVVVGAGGTGAPGGQTDGSDGGDSSFGVHCTGAGGKGGGVHWGGDGGIGTGGDINIAGGGGQGGTNNYTGGAGGSSHLGGGGKSTYYSIGGDGGNYGGGGGGAKNSQAGHGAPGIVIVEEFK